MQFLACFLQNVLSFTYICRLQILLADYFKDLATPTSMPEFDTAFLQQAENDVKNLFNLYTNDSQDTLKKVSIDEIAITFKSLKNGKSPDERHISAEHLKYGGRKLLEYLTVLVNWNFENLQIPKTLKSGIACPILKKGNLHMILIPIGKSQ